MPRPIKPTLDYIHPDLHDLVQPIAGLTPDPKNARKHSQANLDAIRASFTRWGCRKPIVVQRCEDGALVVRAGNGRLQVARDLGWTHLPALVVDEGDQEAIAFALADNRTAELAEWDQGTLAELVDSVPDIDWGAFGWGDLAAELPPAEGLELSELPQANGTSRPPGVLVRDFGAPPFSVLDARQGYWQERKRWWLNQGLQSELGRGGDLAWDLTGKIVNPDGSVTWAKPESRRAADMRSNVTGAPPLPEYADNGTAHMAPGTSIFDPVLTELLVRWFTPEGGRILDPFAGGSVRGVVAAKLGRSYVGCELRPEQVDANRDQADQLGTPGATWVQGDSRVTLDSLEGEFDGILSCPPYYDLEVYSDRPEDLSALGTYADFLEGYREIIAKAVAKLAPNSFACWVVGDLRDKRGFYRNFVGDTIQAFQDAGALLYNEAILVNPVGTLALRAPKQFRSGRKLGKTHQNVLVFYKGDPRAIKGRLGDLSTQDAGDGVEPAPVDRGTPWVEPAPVLIDRGEVAIICEDAITYLRRVRDVPAIITSLPDPEEVGVGVGEWHTFVQRVCGEIADCLAEQSVVFFYQTDRRIDGEVLDKTHLIASCLYSRGFRKIIDKTVLRAGVNKTSLHRPGFTKLTGYSRSLRSGTPTPDTIERGAMAYKNAMGLNAVSVCLDYITDKIPGAKYVLDPFCGHGSVLRVAVERNLGAVGVDLDPDACEKARARMQRDLTD